MANKKRPNDSLYREDIDSTHAAIDAIDEKIVELLAQRQTYTERLAILGKNVRVREFVRSDDVLTKVLSKSHKAGLSLKIARSIWLVMIEAFISHQRSMFDNAPFEPISARSDDKTR